MPAVGGVEAIDGHWVPVGQLRFWPRQSATADKARAAKHAG